MKRSSAITRGGWVKNRFLRKLSSSCFAKGYGYMSLKQMQCLVLFALIHLFMSSAIPAQIVTIKQKSVTLKSFMDFITQKSKYRFIYTDNDLVLAKRKDLFIENTEVEKVLGIYFKDQPLNYKIVDRNIVISPRSTKPSGATSSGTKPPTALAQASVHGKVLLQLGDKQETGVGVTVTVKGTNRRAFTNDQGNFTINAKTGDILVFTYLGYSTREVKVASISTAINITLQEDVVGLDDVVVTGYQVQEKRTITGSMSQIKAEDFEGMPIQSFDQAMQGRMAGVLVQGVSGVPGGPLKVEIRGQGSISAGTNPLYIVDGVEINSEDAATNINAANPLSFLNPDDIESIEVLKDAAAASIYGAQAANGVVLITTKSGKAGSTKFSAEYYTGMTSPIQLLQVMNTQQYLTVRMEAMANFNPAWSPERVRSEVLAESQLPVTMTDAEIAALPSYDWQNEAYQNGQAHNVLMTMSGGTEKTTFRLSGSYNATEGNVIGNNFNRGTMNLRVNHDINRKMKLQATSNLSHIVQNGSYRSWGSYAYLSSPQFTAPYMLPFLPIYNEDGSFNAPVERFPGGYPYNAIQVTDVNTQQSRTANLLTNLRYTYDITKTLKFESRLGLNYRILRTEFYIDPRTQEAYARQGYKSFRVQPSTTFTTSHTLAYNKSIRNTHNINALVGAEFRDYQLYRASGTSEGFPSYQFRYLSAASTILGAEETWLGNRRLGFFSQANYNYKKKLMLSGVLRYDGSSRFGADNRFGLFPSVSAGWDMARERFVRNISWLQQLKLRASYGVTGNSEIPNFASLSLWNGSGSYGGEPGTRTTQIGNSDLRWEKSVTSNIGVDFSAFRRRLYGSVEVYNRESTDLLLNTPLPFTSGFASVFRNTGAVRNQGLEVELNSDIIKKRDFKWTSSFNISFQRNKVLRLYRGISEDADGTDEEEFEETEVTVMPNNSGIRVGYPLHTNFVGQYAGVNAATGRPMWWFGEDRISYAPGSQGSTSYTPYGRGNRLSDYYGGWTNKFTYKRLELNVFFQYDMGRELYNSTNLRLYRNGEAVHNTSLRAYEQRWLTPGQVTAFPRPINGGVEPLSISHTSASSRFLEDASYIRLKQVGLSYKFAPKTISAWKMSRLEVYAQAVNLWTLTKWRGYDPEFYIDDSNFDSNIGQIPMSKVVTMGVRVGF